MAALSFGLLEAYTDGASVDDLAMKLGLPTEFVEARIEAARLCLLYVSGTQKVYDDWRYVN